MIFKLCKPIDLSSCCLAFCFMRTFFPNLSEGFHAIMFFRRELESGWKCHLHIKAVPRCLVFPSVAARSAIDEA